MAEMERKNWAQLPPELLQEIAAHLTDIFDRIRFRAVCIGWRSSPIPRNLPQQFPWLLISNNYAYPGQQINDGKLRFLNISEDKIYNISLPEYENHKIITSSYGWLITYTDDFVQGILEISFSLLNPITHLSYPLPSLSLSAVGSVQPHTNARLFQSVFGLVIAFYDWSLNSIFFCCCGETGWNRIDIPSSDYYSDFILHNGCFFLFNTHTKFTEVFKTRTAEKVSEIPPVWDFVHYFDHNSFVESPYGELLVLDKEGPYTFKLFQLDASENQLKWVNIRSIGGDCTLFHLPHLTMCVASSDFKACRRNCIYYVDGYAGASNSTRVRLFDLEQGHVEAEPIYEGNPFIANWFMPNLSWHEFGTTNFF